MTRALVTGGSGFVGANLVRRLLDIGVETHLLLRPEARLWRLREVLDGCEQHRGGVDDGESLRRALRAARPDWVFHLAAYGAYPQQTDLARMVETNLLGTQRVVEESLRTDASSIVLAGSSSEYGPKDHAPSEDEVLEPDSDYGVTKASATLYGIKEARRSGRSITSLRLYSVYGPWEEPTRFWPTLVSAAMNGRLPPLASPTTARDFVYVDDVVDAFLRAAEQAVTGGIVLNIATGMQASLAEVVAMVQERFEIAQEPPWGGYGPRAWDTDIWVGDPERAAKVLGWRATTSLHDGLERLGAWLSSHVDPASSEDHYPRASEDITRSHGPRTH
jgi:nucleoside-diphosphate-sugar epimerase